MANNGAGKTIGIALGVCLVCSVLVSSVTVLLREKQENNQKQDKLKNILEAGGLYTEDVDIESVYSRRIRPVLVNLKTGNPVSEQEYTEVLNPETFDNRAVSSDPDYSERIPAEKDMAGIRRRPGYMVVYLVTDGDEISRIILPVYGKGLWSTMYGFIALDRNLSTIKGFTFYDQKETPGLGGEVDNPRWKKIWVGKQAYDVDGKVKIEVIKGRVDPSSADAAYRVDGLSGSTLTTRGVNRLVRFWLGDDGYGKYIRRLREEG